MSDYDRWLEAPYQRAAAEEEAYEEFCELNDLDFTENHWPKFEKWVEQQRDEAKIAAYEARLEELEWTRNQEW